MSKIIVLDKRKEDSKEVISLTPTTLEILKKQSQRIEILSEDYNLKRGDLRINPDLDLYSTNMKGHPMSQFALSQLCNKLGVPVRYVNKCIETGRIDLAHDNLSSWLTDYESSTLIRTYKGRVRGVLTSKYSVCDTPEIIDVVDDVLDLNRFNIKGFMLNEERFHLRLVDKTMLPVSGEDLFAGITIDSSDVGRSPIVVTFFIYKQVCTNGLMIAKNNELLFHQKHIGITAEELHESLVASLKNVEYLTEQTVERIQRTRERYNHWSASSEHPEDIQDFVNHIRQQTNLSQDSAHKVINLMNTKYEDTRWGMINAITEVAQDFSLERRIELERIAGNLLVA